MDYLKKTHVCIVTKYLCFITEPITYSYWYVHFLQSAHLSVSCHPGGYENISSGDDIDDIIGDMNDDDQDEQTGRKSGALSWKHKIPSLSNGVQQGPFKTDSLAGIGI